MTGIIAIIASIPLFLLGLSASLLIVAFVEWWSGRDR